MSGTVTTLLGSFPHSVGTAEVQRLRSELFARYNISGAELVQALRTEVHALLVLALPMPGPDQVTDAHRVRADVDRMVDPNHTTAHHWLQKDHSKALWKEADRLVAQTPGVM